MADGQLDSRYGWHIVHLVRLRKCGAVPFHRRACILCARFAAVIAMIMGVMITLSLTATSSACSRR
jgi:hypothetical protein